jgi:hypothetical protein
MKIEYSDCAIKEKDLVGDGELHSVPVVTAETGQQ